MKTLISLVFSLALAVIVNGQQQCSQQMEAVRQCEQNLMQTDPMKSMQDQAIQNCAGTTGAECIRSRRGHEECRQTVDANPAVVTAKQQMNAAVDACFSRYPSTNTGVNPQPFNGQQPYRPATQNFNVQQLPNVQYPVYTSQSNGQQQQPNRPYPQNFNVQQSNGQYQTFTIQSNGQQQPNGQYPIFTVQSNGQQQSNGAYPQPMVRLQPPNGTYPAQPFNGQMPMPPPPPGGPGMQDPNPACRFTQEQHQCIRNATRPSSTNMQQTMQQMQQRMQQMQACKERVSTQCRHGPADTQLCNCLCEARRAFHQAADSAMQTCAQSRGLTFPPKQPETCGNGCQRPPPPGGPGGPGGFPGGPGGFPGGFGGGVRPGPPPQF